MQFHTYTSPGQNQAKDSTILHLEVNLYWIYMSVDVHMQLNEKAFHI